jgi:hypothetical protein
MPKCPYIPSLSVISPISSPNIQSFSSAKHTTARLPLPLLRLTLHLLAHFDIDLEEFAHAAVEADAFAFVEVGFAVGRVYAF